MNNKQFQQFIELMTKAQRVGNELSDIKKRIEGLALNYATLSAKLKNTETNRPQESMYRRYNQNNYKWEKKGGIKCRKCGERGHINRHCMLKKSKYPYNNQRKEKGNFNPTKNISFCELENTNDEEIYTVNNITSIKATKQLANSK
ncbi:3362_t:CDS:2 [Gigaspora margarita]|uniref:3362_t:CDS:1 n=1 Tax=Gigaspora margarita TaxID=4874 RepID=A0ABN7UIV1_GIGMA|nr:3362_t:CDS:2 [Gigaspora margarita]